MHLHAEHNHDHHGHATGRVLRISLVLTAAYIVMLVVVGVRAHSLALLSEAGHNVSDFLALLLSWAAVYFGGRPANASKTYGYQRAGVLAAFINASSLVLISLLIFYEAVHRFYRPEPVQPKLMMMAAFAGVVLNGAITLMLMRGQRDLNMRSVLVHEIGDTLSTAAVILGGWVIQLTGFSWIDPALSVLIGTLILWSSYDIIRESMNILLEGTPRGVQLDEIEAALLALNGVAGVHDLHVWSIGSHSHALSCHINIDDIPPSESEAILCDVKQALATRFDIFHTTIQFESADCDAAAGCRLPLHAGHGNEGNCH